MALTGKRLAFAKAIVNGKSNKQAAIDAGYSAATASAAGSRLAKDAVIVTYVAAHRAAAAKGEPPPAAPGPKFDLAVALQHADPKSFLLAAMNDLELDPKQRIVAAKALMPFVHARPAEGGKKEQRTEAAKGVAGRFAPSAPPKLVSAGGKKV